MITGPILALESSTSTGSVAVGDATGVVAEFVRDVAGGHSSALLPAAEQVLASAGLRPRDLAAVVVGGGPGSFTGLRIAAATAKGMLQALRIPLYSYSGLLATAVAAWSAPGEVCALFDARRRDVFAACYRFGGKTAVEVTMAPDAMSIEAVIERFRETEPPLFVGEGALLHREELGAALGARVGPQHLTLPRASALVWLASTVPAMGEVADPAEWEPAYLRASGAERIAARAAAEAGR
jgi:tRNA threonylcarbamoyladenosine biosynthesis protein TsaB